MSNDSMALLDAAGRRRSPATAPGYLAGRAPHKQGDGVPAERRGSLLVRHGKGDKRREAGMDRFGFEQLAAWLAHRVLLPPGPLFRVIDGRTRGRRWAASAARAELRQLAVAAGVRRRLAPHQLRHAHAVELARESVAINIIQRQLGHTDLGTTSACLQGIDPSEIIDAVRSRRPPTISATAGLAL